MKDWWLDERAHAGREHLDAGYVAGYERKAGYDPAEDIDALQRLGLGRASVVVDLGAGTGVFAAAVAPFCREVIAVDISPAMTAAIRARVDRYSSTIAASSASVCVRMAETLAARAVAWRLSTPACG